MKFFDHFEANVRLHGETKRRPVDLFAEEQPKLQPLPAHSSKRPGK